MGVGLIIGMPLMLWESGGHTSTGLRVSLTIIFVLMGAGCLVGILRYRVILEPDAITVPHLSSTRRLRCDEIEGFRIFNSRGGSSRILIPRDENKQKLRFLIMWQSDPAFSSWFAGIPEGKSGWLD